MLSENNHESLKIHHVKTDRTYTSSSLPTALPSITRQSPVLHLSCLVSSELPLPLSPKEA